MNYFLLSGQIMSHIALIYAMFVFGVNDWLVVLLMYFIGGCLGGSVTFHRLLSHRSWNAPDWWYYVGSVCGMLFLIGSPLAWANNHIAHHKYVDTLKDPHSPNTKNVFRVQWLSMIDSAKSFRYGLRNINPFQSFLHQHYIKLHLVYLFTLTVVFGLKTACVLYLVPSAVIWNMASLVNTVNHLSVLSNYRNYADSKDSSQNNVLTGLLVWGEGWHNNHHRYPGEAKFGRKWWELDISYVVIKLLEKR